MGFVNLPPSARPASGGPDFLSRAAGLLTTLVFGVVLGLQYWSPNKRMIQVLVAIAVFGVAWRLSMLATLNFLIFLMPYPKGTVFGNTNLAFILIVLVLWLLRMSLRMAPAARGTPIDVPILGMVLWHVLSFYNMTDHTTVPTGILNFELFLGCVALFYLVVNTVRTQRDLIRLHQMQLLCAFLTFVIAAWEARHAGKVLIPGLLDFTETLGHDFNTRDVRVGGSFRDYELLSEYCGIVFLLVVFYLVRAKNQTQRVLWGLFGLFNVYTMFTTVTRGVIVSLALTLPYLFFTIRRRLNPARFLSGVVAILLLAVTMNYFVAKYTNSGDLFERLGTTKLVHGVVPEARQDTWANAWDRALVHPILGQGPYYTDIPGYHRVWPHNVYLYIANIIGFPGLLFYLLLLIGLVMVLRPVVDDLNHPSYADAYLIVARTQLFMFMVDEVKIDFLRNSIYQFQVFLLFGTWMAAYLVSRNEGVRAGYFVATSEPLPSRRAA